MMFHTFTALFITAICVSCSRASAAAAAVTDAEPAATSGSTPRCTLLQQLLGVGRSVNFTKRYVKELVDQSVRAEQECTYYLWTARGNITFSSKVLYDGRRSRGSSNVYVKLAERAFEEAKLDHEILRETVYSVERNLLVIRSQSAEMNRNGYEAVKESKKAVAKLVRAANRYVGRHYGGDDDISETCKLAPASGVTFASLEHAIRNITDEMVDSDALEGARKVFRSLVEVEEARKKAMRVAQEIKEGKQLAQGAEARVAGHANAVFSVMRTSKQSMTINHSRGGTNASQFLWNWIKFLLLSLISAAAP
ncbi:T. brucei spp.-specific protein [Trypanosoma brucei gambiense DAL972]|uniref:T. brucei spp.-specific protein n=2 Tax=Trypanosoma brucei TaxID=5691 RepID=D0A271_TRYB9|nr:T. brucei spp.-specific protein [Trypanosoma brucei gambiense DAL972]RHW68999.1 Laminin-like protein [Trypanosoma brucei equiperdum]CBH15365.1 T. brucei spp.-specific protein [Trypanosoma brucei gambiense DAL972]|eukprot:XP_011777629.1 T. brucei spp.-specific protein [Trypanosoma brucei gambiense DAL972]